MSMAKDYERHNEAAKLGWIIYYFMGIHIEGEAIKDTITYMQAIISPRKAPPTRTIPTTSAELLRKFHERR